MTNSGRISKTQIDRLGERLKREPLTDEDLRRLDEYRRSFIPAYEYVVSELESKLRISATGRPAKSTPSIVGKLQRESLRLSQMQDIAGCRLTVKDPVEQDRVVRRIKRIFPRSVVVDRRAKPSHGYRAVHVIVNHDGKLIEIQVRTSLQHLWAELSEKLSDLAGVDLKYGGGTERLRRVLDGTSKTAADLEGMELQMPGILREAGKLDNAGLRKEGRKLLKEIRLQREKFAEDLAAMASSLNREESGQ